VKSLAADTMTPETRVKGLVPIVEGIDHAPKGLIALLKGENLGKQHVKLA
jgi:NADPH-dependent curcumin reductase CurA